MLLLVLIGSLFCFDLKMFGRREGYPMLKLWHITALEGLIVDLWITYQMGLSAAKFELLSVVCGRFEPYQLSQFTLSKH